MLKNEVHPTPTYVVSRQAPYYQSLLYTVEIAAGGYDYCGSDMLVDTYSELGELRVFDDPREAVKAAIAILEQWRKDCPNEQIGIAYGHTLGMFTELPEGTIEEASAWAEAQWDSLTKCDYCGERPVPKNHWLATSCLDDDVFCSERCADFAIEDFFARMGELELEESL